jgi:hypothetical protein
MAAREEDSSVHPVDPDQGVKPIVNVCAVSVGSGASVASAGLEASEVPDGANVVMDVVTACGPAFTRSGSQPWEPGCAGDDQFGLEGVDELSASGLSSASSTEPTDARTPWWSAGVLVLSIEAYCLPAVAVLN